MNTAFHLGDSLNMNNLFKNVYTDATPMFIQISDDLVVCVVKNDLKLPIDKFTQALEDGIEYCANTTHTIDNDWNISHHIQHNGDSSLNMRHKIVFYIAR